MFYQTNVNKSLNSWGKNKLKLHNDPTRRSEGDVTEEIKGFFLVKICNHWKNS